MKITDEQINAAGRILYGRDETRVQDLPKGGKEVVGRIAVALAERDELMRAHRATRKTEDYDAWYAADQKVDAHLRRVGLIGEEG